MAGGVDWVGIDVSSVVALPLCLACLAFFDVALVVADESSLPVLDCIEVSVWPAGAVAAPAAVSLVMPAPAAVLPDGAVLVAASGAAGAIAPGCWSVVDGWKALGFWALILALMAEVSILAFFQV